MALDGNVDHSGSETYALATESSTFEDVFMRFASWCNATEACELNGHDVPTLVDQATREPIRHLAVMLLQPVVQMSQAKICSATFNRFLSSKTPSKLSANKDGSNSLKPYQKLHPATRPFSPLNLPKTKPLKCFPVSPLAAWIGFIALAAQQISHIDMK